MNVICKPLIFLNGTPRTVALSVWQGLCSPDGEFHKMTGRSADCALAFIREHNDGRQALAFMQCMRIQFDGEGRAITWNMSTLRLERECVLGPDARPVAKYSKYRQEPHFWFPNAEELQRMAHALSPRKATELKAQLLHSTIRASRPAATPSMVPPPAHAEHRAEQ